MEDDAIIDLAESLRYAGFDTAAFRGKLVTAKWTEEDVVKALVTYIMMGNNLTSDKKINRATNPAVARTTVSWAASKGVVAQVGGGDPITLARIAKAYAPVLYCLRLKLDAKIKVQIPSSSPKPVCDLAFLGYEETTVGAGSVDFVERFGLIITRVTDKKSTDQEILARNRQIAQSAYEGLKADTALLTSMNAKVTVAAFKPLMKELHKIPVPPRPSGAT
jgi:hypothetical protein